MGGDGVGLGLVVGVGGDELMDGVDEVGVADDFWVQDAGVGDDCVLVCEHDEVVDGGECVAALFEPGLQLPLLVLGLLDRVLEQFF